MEKSFTTIRNGIIATVAGGLILTFILWLIGFLPTAWLKQAGVWVWDILRLDVPLPMWFLGLLVVLVIVSGLHLYKHFTELKTSSTLAESTAPPAADQGAAPAPEAAQEQPELSELELAVLRCLAQADGDALELESIAHRIANNYLRTEQALHRLQQRDLIDLAQSYADPTVYYLTDAGRDQVIELGMA